MSTQATRQYQDYRREKGDGHENGRKLLNNMNNHSSLVKLFQLHSARVHKNERLEEECVTS